MKLKILPTKKYRYKRPLPNDKNELTEYLFCDWKIPHPPGGE